MKSFISYFSKRFSGQKESRADLSCGIFTPLNALTYSTEAKTIPLGLDPFPYRVSQGVNTMRCSFCTELFTSHDSEPEER
jgi:hypothetical protein